MIYKKFEDKVLSYFKENEEFEYENKKFKVLISGKPKALTRGGEPKTDVYILAEEVDVPENKKEIKISCKLLNKNEFQENKITAERAEEIWGEDWSRIIQNVTQEIHSRFEESQVYFPVGQLKTKKTMFTNGWKLEITNKTRNLSGLLAFSDEDVRNIIYKGSTLSPNKKNSKVNRCSIVDSGVAEFILVSSLASINSSEDVLRNMVLIDDYPIVPHYIVFTANNLMVLTKKSDGKRSLAVQVNWNANLEGNGMEYTLNYLNPLDPDHSGDKIAENTLNEIDKLRTIQRGREIKGLSDDYYSEFI